MSAFDLGFTHLLRQAWELGASDVHVEPQLDESLQIRMRLDGRLQTWRRIEDAARARRFAEVIKRCTGCDTGKLGVPQDVRFGTEEPPCDFRVALVPSLVAEKFVLRLLPRQLSFDLDAYRMPGVAKTALRTALTKRDGIIVVSGPTGSGKTTLLYNALAALNADDQAIYTLEDPVEYRLPGLTQSQVDRERGIGFAQLLRSLMRADPDVILVGEIRDAETAEAAFHAAKTGHLVLTTVHATDTAQIRERLEDLGVSPAAFGATVQFASAQRLLPRVCEECRVFDEDGLRLLEAAHPGVRASYRGVGCEACGGSGTAGRVLLMGWQRRRPDEGGRSVLELEQSLRASVRSAAEEGVVRAVDAAGL